MAANVLFHEWHMFQMEKEFTEEFLCTSEEEIRGVFKELDPESQEHILRYVGVKRDFMIVGKDPGCYFYNYSKFYRKEEIRKIPKTEAALKRETWKYKNGQNIHLGSCESFLYHHGLVYCPETVKKYIRDGIFLDVGACYGDSTLVFLKYYHPEKVFAFEPSRPNQNICHAIMRQNGIDPSRYEVIPLGLGRECKSLYYCEQQGGGNSLRNRENGTVKTDIVTCDSFCAERKLSGIRLMKCDIEGMGLDMLSGSENVIRENRPVLCLSIYHNRDELFGIYQTLKRWELNYHFTVRMLAFPLAFGELTLIAYPAELDQ